MAAGVALADERECAGGRARSGSGARDVAEQVAEGQTLYGERCANLEVPKSAVRTERRPAPALQTSACPPSTCSVVPVVNPLSIRNR
jgi:hypothetical protein